jgi:hypothetical protein
MASVQAQTAVVRIEHLILPDYVGRGIAGMYAELPHYREAVHGEYVHILADDDVLATTWTVEAIERELGEARPALLLVPVIKGGRHIDGVWPPVNGSIDLGNMVVRRDTWKARCHEYGSRYEGDYDFARALQLASVEPERVPVVLLRGAVSHGAAEGCA